MRSVVLFYPHQKFGGSVQPRTELPLSLLTIATPLDRAGYRVKIIDQRIDERWRTTLADEIAQKPICVGVSSMTGPQIAHGLDASRLVREQGDTPVVWGGIHPTLLPKQTLANENIDIVVQGEGEETFPELVTALEEGRPLSQVKGIWYKEDGAIKGTPSRPLVDLNKQPPLSYHLVDLKEYLVYLFGKGHLTLETSRGCPFRCSFCYNTGVYEGTWRGLTSDEAMTRIRQAVGAHDAIEGILFCDDNFFGDKERAITILRRVKEEIPGILCAKLDGHLSVLQRLSDEELRLIRESGSRMLMIGVESGSPRILEMIKKQLKIPELLRFNERLLGFDIMPLYFLMVGYPTETFEELSQTTALYLRLLRENKGAVSLVNIYTPFPGTGLFDIAVQNGLRPPEKLEDWIPWNWRNVRGPWLSSKMKKTIRMLHFTTMLAQKNNFPRPVKKTNRLMVLLATLYYPIAKMRVKYLCCRFPLEIKLAEWLGLYPRQG